MYFKICYPTICKLQDLLRPLAARSQRCLLMSSFSHRYTFSNFHMPTSTIKLLFTSDTIRYTGSMTSKYTTAFLITGSILHTGTNLQLHQCCSQCSIMCHIFTHCWNYNFQTPCFTPLTPLVIRKISISPLETLLTMSSYIYYHIKQHRMSYLCMYSHCWNCQTVTQLTN